MKKNITINLCGRLFNIDEDAYELLNNYTTTLRNYFRKQEGGEEIANDIEERIAELFAEVKNQGHEAICIENVQDVIKRIGAVEEIAPGANNFDGSGESDFSEKINGAASSINDRVSNWFDGLKRKRFYRDSKGKMLGGVLSGCAKYFGGNVIVWRLVYVLLSVGTIKALFALPAMLLAVFNTNFAFVPFMLIAGLGALLLNSAPVVIYVIVYFLLPEVKSPEDSLRMKGKDITPQNLGNEVAESVREEEEEEASQHHSAAKGCLNGFFSFLAVCVKFFIWCAGIMMFIPCVFFFVMMVIGYFSPEDVSNWMFGRFGYEVYQQTPEYFWTLGISAFAVSFIPAYCSLHCFLGFFDKVKSMSIYQRILWFGLWIFAIIGIIGCFMKIKEPLRQLYTEYYTKSRFEVMESMKTRHEHDGFEFRDIDWEYFQKNGFKLLKAENCSENRYTYSGEYYNGDDEVRYLDAFSWDCDIVYQAEKTDSIQPGRYIVSALARCSDNSRGAFIYAYLGEYGDACEKYLTEIPCYGNQKPEGANPDNVLDYGWVKVSTSVIEVKTPTIIHYGVSTDKYFTGKECTAQWFSATDFDLEKIEEVESESKEANEKIQTKQKKN